MRYLFATVAVLSLLAIVLFGLTGTSAWFTDEEILLNNQVSTGVLDVQITGGPLEGVKLEPGLPTYMAIASFCIRNDGNYNMKWRGWMDQIGDEKGLLQYLEIEGVRNPSGSGGSYGPADEVLFTNQPFSVLENATPYFIVDDSNDPFKPGDAVCYELRGRLSSAAPNEVQNAVVSARLYVFATQLLNDGWSE
jgi:hypothetical protein